jgi:hypothetical protein
MLLVLAVVTYLIHRGLVLYTAFDTVCIPIYETAWGNIAKVATMGWPGAPLDQFYDNCGLHLLTGLLAAPLFALLGSSYLVLKLVPLLLGLGTLLLMWNILDRHFSRTAAGIAVFLFVLGPPTLVKFSMLAMGNHFENLFFQMLILWVFYRMHAARNKEPWLALFGLVAGFSTFLYFGTPVMLAVLALVHIRIRGLGKIRHDLLIVIGPLLVGLVPLVWIQVKTAGRVGELVAKKLEGTGVGARLEVLFYDLLPHGGAYEPLLPRAGPWLEWTYLALFAVAWLTMMPAVARSFREAPPLEESERERARFDSLRAAPLLGYLPAFICFYALTTFTFKPYGPPVEVGQFRYLVPHFCFASMVIGVGIAHHLGAAGGFRRLFGRVLCVPVLVIMGVPFMLVDWSFKETGTGALYQGYDFNDYNNTLMRDSRPDPVSRLRVWDMDLLRAQVGEFGTVERNRIARGVGYHLAGAQALGGRLDGRLVTPPTFDLDEILDHFPDVTLHEGLARGAGNFLKKRARAGDDQPDGVAMQLRGLGERSHPHVSHLIEGMCLGHGYPLARVTREQLRQSLALERIVPPDLHWAWLRGLGGFCGRLLARGIASDREVVEQFIRRLKPADPAEFWVGVGRGVVFQTDNTWMPETLADLVPEAFGEQAFFGAGTAVREVLGETAVQAQWEAGFPSEEWRKAFELGTRNSLPPSPL